MKTLQIHLMRQIIATMVMTVGVFTGVLLLGSIAKEMLFLLLNENLDLWMVARAIGVLIPYLLVYALPIGMLTATLLVFGRLSADQELTAMRASGVSLMSLVTPVLLFSVLMSMVCAMINLDYAPRARHAYREMLFELGRANIGLLLPAGTYVTEFPGLTIYIGDYADNGDMEDVRIYQMEEGKVSVLFRADRATLERDMEAGLASITLYDGQQISFEDNRTFFFSELPLSQPIEIGDDDMGYGKARLANMSLQELLEKRAELRSTGVDVTRVNLQIHSKIAFSFACIGFTLVGIPLGLQSHRRETRIGIFLSLMLVSVYYGFFIFAEAYRDRPEVHPHVFVWIPNLLFQGVGAILLFRADHTVR